jgi:hypothetical protein
MKPITSILGAAIMALLMSAPAMAQGMIPNMNGMNVPWASGLPNQSAFNHWASDHQKAASELQANPSLMYDAAWRKKHPHFQHFIETHPEDWSALKSNSTRYFNPGFNSYLQQHPNWGNQIRRNPELMYDPAWRAQHPEFSNYMHQHPSWWQNTPYVAPAETKFEKHHPHWEHHEEMKQHREEERAQHRAEHHENHEEAH